MIDPQKILARYPASIPRYTSYPTAPHFAPGIGAQMHEAMLAGLDASLPVSLYLHIPFCDRLCWFCGCHTKQTRQYAPVEAYVRVLVQEIALLRARAGRRIPVAEIHFGGGSPSMLSPADFGSIRDGLERCFELASDATISVEIDPSDIVTGDGLSDRVEGLKRIGMNRASIGVQDFAPEVQAAINRPQSFEDTRRLVDVLRETGVSSLNIDALYGLPLQTRLSIDRTISQVVSLAPDRVALFGYAHVPWMKKHQTMIADADLPDAGERFAQAELAADRLAASGYARIGIDHFARPGDSLQVAAANGTLRRNFQGYTTDQCQTLIGLGASSISRFEGGYIQNIPATNSYSESVARGVLPADRGFRTSLDDRMRGHVIERLMCDLSVRYGDLERLFGEAAAPLIREIKLSAGLDPDGLTTADEDGLHIVEAARPFARIVASRFDAYLPNTAFRYSKAV